MARLQPPIPNVPRGHQLYGLMRKHLLAQPYLCTPIAIPACYKTTEPTDTGLRASAS